MQIMVGGVYDPRISWMSFSSRFWQNVSVVGVALDNHCLGMSERRQPDVIAARPRSSRKDELSKQGVRLTSETQEPSLGLNVLMVPRKFSHVICSIFTEASLAP